MEDLITFESDGNQIEGLFTSGSQTKAVIITHPHSLYGGDMHNSVVYMIHKTCIAAGYSTLRFNFRGVGKSGGKYNEGVGEQIDLEAAHVCLTKMGFSAIDLAGYSFGSWVGASLACRSNLFQQVFLISPPVTFMDFNDITPISSLALAIVGDRDEFAELEILRQKMSQLNPDARVEVLPNTDHFYTGSLEKLSAILATAIQ